MRRRTDLARFEEMMDNGKIIPEPVITDEKPSHNYIKQCRKSNIKIDKAIDHYADAYSSSADYFVR